jgi:hypothetical protein
MRRTFEGSEHLMRPALVAIILVLAFLAIRRALVPPEFGKYGHYRPGSLDEIAARTPVFAGREACASCHVDVAAAKSKGPHANVGCEAWRLRPRSRGSPWDSRYLLCCGYGERSRRVLSGP